MSDADPKENQEEQQEEDQPPPRIPVKPEQIQAGLSKIQRTADGLSYAYSTLNISGSGEELQELEDHLRPYIHLSTLNISGNDLKDIDTVATLPNLVNLIANDCAVENLRFMSDNDQALQYLQWVNLNNNKKIVELPALRQPQLSKLELCDCEIANCEMFNGHSRITILKLSRNKLTNTKGLCHLIQCEQLWLDENQISNIEDMLNMPQLKMLNLGKNQNITSLAAMKPLPSLEDLDVSGNDLKTSDVLSHLADYKKLKIVKMEECPVAGELGDGLKREMLFRTNWPQVQLESVNGEEITEEDTDEYKKARKGMRKAEEERIKAEEEARIKAEEEAKNGPPKDDDGEEANPDE